VLTFVKWQVTLRDPMWQVTLRTAVMGSDNSFNKLFFNFP